ncbi:hypothetical protein [Polynucleobacter sp.]|jgi:hypothetical protein|nr:hypothetical protein [Polynucleobacter sp.]MDP3122043.1 hypothetical protein [Polynucleobacter sp.]
MNTENALIALTYLLKYQEITCNLAWGAQAGKGFWNMALFWRQFNTLCQ